MTSHDLPRSDTISQDLPRSPTISPSSPQTGLAIATKALWLYVLEMQAHTTEEGGGGRDTAATVRAGGGGGGAGGSGGGGGFVCVRELVLPGSAQCEQLEWCGRHLCLAHRTEYVIISARSGAVRTTPPLLPRPPSTSIDLL